ncbi:MAG: formate--tetrahydrofolate ligase [Christensenellales bacterium]|jgi:formate--tetrahydrofolate ligase
MSNRSDIEIARQAKPLPIRDIAARIGIPTAAIELYGEYKAKINIFNSDFPKAEKCGKLVLVTAITPTPAGEGKTTTTVGLGDALTRLGKKAVIALREPSLGPVFGMKGGAAGGGYAQVIPMEDINLHFTGDIHAIGSANNLLAALLDNHIHQGNSLDIDTRRITWRRCLDINDRQLRFITDGLGGRVNGVPREDGFDITVASEIMAVLCLSSGLSDMKKRLSRIIVAYSRCGNPVTAGDLKAEGALTALLKDAIKPNLVQTLENTPALIHGGPFANIAHGCNSLSATTTALSLGDYTVTEAGFGADLGAEKFLDIKCRSGSIWPDAAVIVATARALKHHGGCPKEILQHEDIPALKDGLSNLKKHIETISGLYRLPTVVAINKFPTDTAAELQEIISFCESIGVKAAVTDAWAKGGAGAEDLARLVIEAADTSLGEPNYAYELDISPADKIDQIARRVYGADGADILPAAALELERISEMGLSNLPICIAKTQYSFSDDPLKKGSPSGFRITVRGIRLSAGAGFIVALTGDIMTMPGLPRIPAAESIDVDDEGNMSGLF